MTVHMSKMSGKLKGIPAINTNTLTNLFCIQQHKTATICLDCYSFEMLEGYRKNCTPAFERNSALLSEHIPWDDLPVLNFAYVRYSAHGEIMTDYGKLEWIWCAIDEIILNYPDIETIYPLETAQDLVHQLREPYLVE